MWTSPVASVCMEQNLHKRVSFHVTETDKPYILLHLAFSSEEHFHFELSASVIQDNF